MLIENQSIDFDNAALFIKKISSNWVCLEENVFMEMRALGKIPKSFRFDPFNEDQVNDILLKASDLNKSGSNIHVTINPAKDNGLSPAPIAVRDSDIIATSSAFVDADELGVADNLRENALREADFAVVTGTIPYFRAHFYWLFERPEKDLAKWRHLQELLANHHQTDRAVSNPSRIMRLPGFTTHPNKSKLARGYVSEIARLIEFGGAA